MSYENWVELDLRYRWSPQDGGRTVRTWEGPSNEEAEFVATIPAGFISYDRLAKQDGWVTLTVEYGNTQGDTTPVPRPPTDPDYGLISRTWECVPNKVQLPLAAHPNVDTLFLRDSTWPGRIQAAAAGFSAAYQAYVRARAEGDTGATEPTVTIPTPPTAATAAERALATQYLAVLVSYPDETWDAPQYVLRKNQTVTTDTVLRVAHTNVSRYHTYAALVRAEPTLPAAVLLVPGGLTSLLWRKEPPNVQYESTGRVLLTQEWTGFANYLEFIGGTLIR